MFTSDLNAFGITSKHTLIHQNIQEMKMKIDMLELMQKTVGRWVGFVFDRRVAAARKTA